MNKTYTGTEPTEGRTIGVDPNVIPLGSKVKVNGHIYIAEDTGNMTGNVIDVFVSDHQQATDLGTYTTEVLICTN